MNLNLAIFELERMNREISSRLIDLYVNYFRGNFNFPYNDVDNLFGRYDLLYAKVSKQSSSILRKTISKASFSDNDIAKELEKLSRENIILQVKRRVLGEIYFDVLKFIPVDVESRDIIFNKLLPLVKGFDTLQIADIYMRFKRSASIRGIVLDDNSMRMLQGMFVDYIMLELSNSQGNDSSLWNYRMVCEQILGEEDFSFSNSGIRGK